MDRNVSRVDRARWASFVRNKLVPSHLVMPAGLGLHEWSRAYRNLIFAMARFVRDRGGVATAELARAFQRTYDREVLSHFTESDIRLLMAKSVEYDLPQSPDRR